MRGKKTLINSLMGLVEELVAIVSAFVLPRLILSVFGSDYNGLIASITQFLQCAVLLRCGIGGATRAALYKPLAEKNYTEINAIIKATDSFMKRIGSILGLLILGFASIYPIFVSDRFSWLFTFSLFLIIGASSFAESFFGITYMILLQADQRLWISSLFRSVCYILNLAISIILIKGNCSIHIVKLGSSIVYVLYPILLQIYIRRRYRLNLKVKPNNSAIKDRWNAFWHQFSLFVMDNTDIMILTVFSNVLEISVYSVYNMIAFGIRRLVMAFSNGLEAAFGNMIANKETTAVKENLSIIETFVFSISTIVYSSAMVLILSFVEIYTKGINDVNYYRPLFSYILLIAQFFYCVRIPYQMVVQAAGDYKQTRKYAIAEPIINIGVSLILVIRLGIVGVAIGTLVACIFKTIMFENYMSQYIVYRNRFISLFKIAISICEAYIIILLCNSFPFPCPISYYQWTLNALITTSIATIIVTTFSLLLFRNDCITIIKKLINIIKHN